MEEAMQQQVQGAKDAVGAVVGDKVDTVVTFYKSGFFGFGEEGNFKYWSFAHFIPIILFLVGIFLIWRYRDWFRKWKHEETFRFIWAFVMLMVEMSYFWRLLYVGSSETGEIVNLLDKLPLQVCEWTCIISCFMLMKKSNNLYQICFYVCFSAGLFPLLTPAVITSTGPAYYRYYQYWLEHLLPMLAVLYMTFVHGSRPKLKGIFYGAGMLAALAVPSLIANFNIKGANYLYLAQNTDGDSIANLLPENIWVRLLLFAAVVFPLFVGLYYLAKLLDKKFGAGRTPAATEGEQPVVEAEATSESDTPEEDVKEPAMVGEKKE